MILESLHYSQVGKNQQLVVTSLLKVGDYIDNVTRGTVL